MHIGTEQVWGPLIAILINVVMIITIDISLCFAGNSRPRFVAHFLFGIRSRWPEEQGEHGDWKFQVRRGPQGPRDHRVAGLFGRHIKRSSSNLIQPVA